MMNPRECAECWKILCSCYDTTISENCPRITMNVIIDTLGIEKAKEVLATVSKIKQSDGRIYGLNRQYMDSIPVNPECVSWRHGNPMICAELDHIHTSHISNLITELIIIEKEKESDKEQEEADR